MGPEEVTVNGVYFDVNFGWLSDCPYQLFILYDSALRFLDFRRTSVYVKLLHASKSGVFRLEVGLLLYTLFKMWVLRKGV